MNKNFKGAITKENLEAFDTVLAIKLTWTKHIVKAVNIVAIYEVLPSREW